MKTKSSFPALLHTGHCPRINLEQFLIILAVDTKSCPNALEVCEIFERTLNRYFDKTVVINVHCDRVGCSMVN